VCTNNSIKLIRLVKSTFKENQNRDLNFNWSLNCFCGFGKSTLPFPVFQSVFHSFDRFANFNYVISWYYINQHKKVITSTNRRFATVSVCVFDSAIIIEKGKNI
jgi:hypothetical protein